MPRLFRYRLVNVGDAAATYPDTSFDAAGENLCVIQPNGTGKSTAVKFLLHALVPGREVDRGSARTVKEYLAPGRVAHVALEFGEFDADGNPLRRKVIVGLSLDLKAGELRKFRYVIVGDFASGTSPADITRLPLSRLEERETAAGSQRGRVVATFEEIRAFLADLEEQTDYQVFPLPPGTNQEAVSEVLQRFGLDDAAWKTIAHLNQRESAFDLLVQEHNTSTKLVDHFLLPHLQVEENLEQVRRHADQTRIALANLPDVERTLAALNSLKPRLLRYGEKLREAMRTSVAHETAEGALLAIVTRLSSAIAANSLDIAAAAAERERTAAALDAATAHLKRIEARLAAAVLRDEQLRLAAATRARADAEAARTNALDDVTEVEAIALWLEAAALRDQSKVIATTLADQGKDAKSLLAAEEKAAGRLLYWLVSSRARAGEALARHISRLSELRDEARRLNAALLDVTSTAKAGRTQVADLDKWLRDANEQLHAVGAPSADSLISDVNARMLAVERATEHLRASERAELGAADRSKLSREAAAASAQRRLHGRQMLDRKQEVLEQLKSAEAKAATVLARFSLGDPQTEAKDAVSLLLERISGAERLLHVASSRRETLEAEAAYFAEHGTPRPNDDVLAIDAALKESGLKARPAVAYMKEGLDETERHRLLAERPAVVSGLVVERADAERLMKRFAEATRSVSLRAAPLLFAREELFSKSSDSALLTLGHPSLDRFVDEAVAREWSVAVTEEKVGVKEQESALREQLSQFRADLGTVTHYLKEWPLDRRSLIRAELEQAIAEESNLGRQAAADAALLGDALSAEEAARERTKGARDTVSHMRDELSQLQRVADVWARPFGEKELALGVATAAVEAAEATAVTLRAQLSEHQALVDAADRSRRKAEGDLDAVDREARTLSAAVAEENDEPIEVLRKEHELAGADLRKNNVLLKYLEEERARLSNGAGRKEVEAERKIERMELPKQGSVRKRLADPKALATFDLHAARALADDAVARANVAAANAQSAEAVAKSLIAAAKERHRKHPDVAPESVEEPVVALESLEVTARAAVQTATESAAHSAEQERRASEFGRLLSVVATQQGAGALLPAAPPTPLAPDELEPLAKSLGEAVRKRDRAAVERTSAWDAQQAHFDTIVEAIRTLDAGARQDIGSLDDLQDAQKKADWSCALTMLSAFEQRVGQLEGAAAAEKERLDSDVESIVHDLVRMGEELAERLKQAAALSKIQVSGSGGIPMLTIGLAMAGEERAREKGRVLFHTFREAVRNKRMTAGTAALEVLSAPQLLRCVVDGEPDVRFLKPQDDLAAAKHVRWEIAAKWSGGESFVTGLVLLMALLTYRARDRMRSPETSQAILLDNPVGKVNAPNLLRIPFELARANRFQLIALTGIREVGVVAQFDRALSITKVPYGSRFLVRERTDDALVASAGQWSNDFDIATISRDPLQ